MTANNRKPKKVNTNMDKSKIIKFFLIGLGLIISIYILTHYLIKKEIAKKIENAGYSYNDIDFNMIFGNIELTDISNIENSDSTNAPTIKCEIEKIKLSGFSYWAHFVNDKISVEHLEVGVGNIIIDPKANEDNKDARSKAIMIEKIDLDSIRFTLLGEKNQKRWERTKILVSQLSLDTFSIDRSTDINFRVTQLKSKDFSYRHSLELHEISANKIDLEEEDLVIQNFSVNPLKSKKEFAKNPFGRKEMFYLDNELIRIKGLDWSRLITTGEISINNINSQNSNFKIYSNENVGKSKPKEYKALPTARTLGSDLKYHVENVELSDASIEYERLGKDKEKSGSIFWNQINTRVTNVTNDSSIIANAPTTKFDVNCKFMGEAAMQLYSTFDLTSPKSAYQLNLSLEAMSMLPFNKILEDVGNVRIKNGDIERLSMQLKADDDIATGTLELIYQDLKVRMLNGASRESKNPLKWIGARILVRKNNKGKNANIGEIKVDRDQITTIWHQLWTAVFDGFKAIAFPEFMDGK